MITDRQEKILNILIQEYINKAKPVGSEFLADNYDFGFCPATIRNEMQKLTDSGYLCQPHTSAGRIPTSKGYRFFVDDLLDSDFEQDLFFSDFEFSELKAETKKIINLFKFTELLTRNLALASSNLALIYLFKSDFVWKDGWKEVFHNPEFKDIDYIESFIKTVEKFERDIKKFAEEKEDLSEVKIYIGRENSILNSKDFSVIVSKAKFPEKEEGLLAIFGPNRMAYDKNIGLINFLIKKLNKGY